jgi:hypothetical protein
MRNAAKSLAAGLALTLMLAALTVSAGAQSYPPPVGSLSVQAAPVAPDGTTDVTATVLDNNGDPVAGADVVFTIVSQPGDDAQWLGGGLQTTATTDENGIATAVLVAGAETGSIVIETVSGEMTSQVTVAVEEEAQAPSTVPSTGGLPGDGEGGLAPWQIIALTIGALALAGGLLAARQKGGRA